MKNSLLFICGCLLLIFHGHPLNAQGKKNYFQKIQKNCDFKNSNKQSYYKITFLGEKNLGKVCFYSFLDFSKYNDDEKLKMIKELLLYEGDSDLCALVVSCYNPYVSRTVPMGLKFYSIQVEALFIINHIIETKPYFYSAFPIIAEKERENFETIDGNLIKKAFQYYKDWLKEAEKQGISQMIKMKLYPLNENHNVFWY